MNFFKEKQNMKKREQAWKNTWNHIESIEEIYRNYGIKSVIDCFKHLLSNEKRGSILDVGCGAGFYFNFFKSLGFREVMGLEYDEGNIKKAKELNRNLQVKILQGDIRDLPSPLEKNYFDVVLSLGLIEHFVYPIDIIRKLLEIIKKDGTVILEMPNFRNWFYYWYNLKRKNELPFHLWWGVKEWCRVLEKMKGCRLEEVQTGVFWAYSAYLPKVINKISPKLLDAEIAIENRLFKKCGSLTFYKLRKY